MTKIQKQNEVIRNALKHGCLVERIWVRNNEIITAHVFTSDEIALLVRILKIRSEL